MALTAVDLSQNSKRVTPDRDHELILGNLAAAVGSRGGVAKLRAVITDLIIPDVISQIVAGTNITIDRSTPGQITINYQAPAPADHRRYALWSSSANIPTASQFQAGASSQTDTITVPATPGNASSFLHFAELFDDFDDIREEGSAFNSRNLFVDTPSPLIIGGTTHYIYSSRFAINAYADAQNWVLRRP